ncbi:MAG: hypothetical protein LZF60_140059 [Nitrospira sp.]|nr:MAG: hypothetical protein LZF60_140059 [Nitrospira sp.]
MRDGAETGIVSEGIAQIIEDLGNSAPGANGVGQTVRRSSSLLSLQASYLSACLTPS